MKKKSDYMFSMVIALAKYIRKKKKDSGFASKVLVEIVHYKDDEKTSICFGDKTYFVIGNADVLEYANMALEQSGCDGICYQANKNTISVVLYGKPIKEFVKLSRLIYKYTGIMINRNDISIEYSALPSYYNDYLCYNKTSCLKAMNFIKANKKRDKLEIDFCELNTKSLKKKFAIMMVKTNSGKVKAKQYLYV